MADSIDESKNVSVTDDELENNSKGELIKLAGKLRDRRNDLNQMALDTNFNEPTDINTGNDPVHVDRQGLLFESDNKRLRGNINFRVQSFSVEAWVRFDSNPLANNQFVVSGGGN